MTTVFYQIENTNRGKKLYIFIYNFNVYLIYNI